MVAFESSHSTGLALSKLLKNKKTIEWKFSAKGPKGIVLKRNTTHRIDAHGLTRGVILDWHGSKVCFVASKTAIEFLTTMNDGRKGSKRRFEITPQRFGNRHSCTSGNPHNLGGTSKDSISFEIDRKDQYSCEPLRV